MDVKKKKHFDGVKKAGHSWTALGIKAVTSSHNNAAKQEIIKQHGGEDDCRLALKLQLEYENSSDE